MIKLFDSSSRLRCIAFDLSIFIIFRNQRLCQEQLHLLDSGIEQRNHHSSFAQLECMLGRCCCLPRPCGSPEDKEQSSNENGIRNGRGRKREEHYYKLGDSFKLTGVRYAVVR